MALKQGWVLLLAFIFLNAAVAYKQPEYVGEISPSQDGYVYSNMQRPQATYRQAEERDDQQQAAQRPQQAPPTYRPQPMMPPPPPDDPNVIVVPRVGLVRGRIGFKQIGNKAPINAFLGLRYGHVRSGIGRFQQAEPVNYDLNTNKPIDATTTPANCPQFPDLAIVNASEAQGQNVDDCLTLNIYTPGKPGNYPVIVFIHGEMLFDGSAEEGQPDYFLEHDVVLVTINYRLAPFGFLTTLTEELPGNVALADLHMALDWIQQNIRPFNGDPDQVTLMGQAGGATLAHALSLSNKAQGLFHKLILQSGTALNPYFLDEDPIGTARSFARLARCPFHASKRQGQSFAECLARYPTFELLKLMERFWDENEIRGLRFNGGFKLVYGDKLGYLESHPAALVQTSNYPIMAGVTKDVGAFIMSRAMFTQLQQLRSSNASDYINVVLKHTTQPRYYQIWQRWAIEHIFTDDEIRHPSFNSLSRGLLELVNLVLYRGPIIDSIRFSYKKNPTFLFCFDYRGQFHRFGHLSNPLPFAIDATLSDDSVYFFPYPEDVSQLNADDKTLSRALVTMWVNFAQFNMPNFTPGIWPNVTGEYGPFVRFTNSMDALIEMDYHFGEGIPVPNLYPEYMPSTTTTRRPRPNYAQPNREQQYAPQYPPPQQHQRPSYPYEHVLNNGAVNWPQHPQQAEQYQQNAQQNHARNMRKFH